MRLYRKTEDPLITEPVGLVGTGDPVMTSLYNGELLNYKTDSVRISSDYN